MGYTTEFDGQVTVEPPLNAAEVAYLRKFAETRRMRRERGPYFVGGSDFFGQGHDSDIIDYNAPPDGQPELWCQWESTEDGAAIEWNGTEKFYGAAEWMKYLVEHFLRSGAAGTGAPELDGFTFDHVVNGVIEAQGEDGDDRWDLVVQDNIVRVQKYEFVRTTETTVGEPEEV